MIYLFNDVKELTGTVRNNHILNLLYEREKNGIYSVSAEIPVTYNDQGTIYNYNKKIQKSDFLGHYDREGRFQLHKIAAVDIENGSIFVKGIHIFFDEAKAGAIIQDRRFINREIIDGARVAFESIGWSVTDFDVSVGKTYNFYNVTPLEARQILVETFGFEFDYWLDFDGKKVTNRHVAVKEKIGEKSNKRYTYGHNVLNIRAEQDYSEIYTAVIGRGKGEEIEETGGYGRRIEYTDVVWTTPSKPLNKPAGTRVLEDPNATQLFGYKENGVVKPRVKVEVFSDIEEPSELIQASYEWLMDNNVPKAVFSLKVADGDGLNLGDEVYVIYRDIDLVKSARVEKVIDDLVSGNRDVEFGDTAYFDTDRRLSGLRSDLKRYSGETGDRIYRLKMEFNRRFDEEVSSWVSEFEQNLIDQKALIEADRENMTNLIEDTRTEWTENFDASVAEAHRLREENYNAMSEHVNTAVDTTRTELENAISTEVEQAKLYAEQQAQAKSDAVRTDLETVTSGHQQMLDDLEGDVINIDDFLGDKTQNLDWKLSSLRDEMHDVIASINQSNPNLIIGTTLENADFLEPWSSSQLQLNTVESLNFIRVIDDNVRTNSGYSYPAESSLFNGRTYTLAFDFRSFGVTELDYSYFLNENGNIPIHFGSTINLANLSGLVADGKWRRYYRTFTFTGETRPDYALLLGTWYERGSTARGFFDTRQVMLYEGDVQVPWQPAPQDNRQIVTQLSREIFELQDGIKSLATKTEFDLLTGEFTQFTNDYVETSEVVERTLQKHDNWFSDNGATLLHSAELVNSKVWMNDVSDIGSNLIPFADIAFLDNRRMWDFWSAGSTAITSDGYLRVRSINSSTTIGMQSKKFNVEGGKQITLSWRGYVSGGVSTTWNNTYLMRDTGSNINLTSHLKFGSLQDDGSRVIEATFQVPESGEYWVMIGSGVSAPAGSDVSIYFKEPKLEIGTKRTPFMNAFSNVEQMANRIAMQVQSIDGEFLSQSDLQITPNYWQLGSMRIGAENVSSVLRGSPDALDAVVSNFNLTGNLNAKGQITSLAVDAIEGNFAKLFASQLTANVINGSHIESNTIEIKHLTGYDAILETLMARTVFSNEVTAKVGNYIDINAGNIVTAGLSANVITSDHIQVGTALVNKMFATSARIDQLITKTHFVNEMNALTMNVIDLNASQIRTRLLSANTIEASWIKSGTALLDRVFSSTAMFERMMAKSGFVTTLNTVTIDTDQITIRRPDGGALISQGMQRFGSPIITKPFMTGDVYFENQNYVTGSRGTETFEVAFAEHSGRWATFNFNISLRHNSKDASALVGVVVRRGTAPPGVHIAHEYREFMAYRDSGSRSYDVDVRLPVPTYGALSWTLEFYVIGDLGNYARIRSSRCWVSS